MEFINQIALITGGASGMGKACAQYLQAQGMTFKSETAEGREHGLRTNSLE